MRDKLVNGELDMAHVLYGLIYGVHLGTGGPKKDMAADGAHRYQRSGDHAVEGARGQGRRRRPPSKLMATEKREYTFRRDLPDGTHAMWMH